VDAGKFRGGGGLFHLGLALEEKDIEGFAEGCLERMGEDETLTRSDSAGISGRTNCSGRWYSKASRPIVRPGRGGLRVIEVVQKLHVVPTCSGPSANSSPGDTRLDTI
jgi:hypothetical protein